MTFSRPLYTSPPRAPLRPATRRASYASPDAAILAIPKGVQTRPGKRAPTMSERAWMDACVAHGCIACWLDGTVSRPTCVHHILRGGRRIGHLFTLPLCDPGHHQGGDALGMISRHPWKARFEEKYGPELELLRQMKKRIGGNHG